MKRYPKIKPIKDQLPITKATRKHHQEILEKSILPLLPIKRKPLISRFYNEAQEREIVEAYKEAKKIKDCFHLAFKYTKRNPNVNPALMSAQSSGQQKVNTQRQGTRTESKSEVFTDNSGKTLKIIVTLPCSR